MKKTGKATNRYTLDNTIDFFRQSGLNKKKARILAALFLEHPEGLSSARLDEHFKEKEEDNIEITLKSLASEGYIISMPGETRESIWKINPDFIVGQLKRQIHSISEFRSVLREVIILSKNETEEYEILHEFTAAYINQVNNLIHNWYDEQK